MSKNCRVLPDRWACLDEPLKPTCAANPPSPSTVHSVNAFPVVRRWLGPPSIIPGPIRGTQSGGDRMVQSHAQRTHLQVYDRPQHLEVSGRLTRAVGSIQPAHSFQHRHGTGRRKLMFMMSTCLGHVTRESKITESKDKRGVVFSLTHHIPHLATRL